MHQVNDGKFPDNSPVEIRFPRTEQQELGDRSAWPWLPGSILEQCGPVRGSRLARPPRAVRDARLIFR